MSTKPLDCKRPPPADDAQLYELLVSNIAETAVFLLDADGCIISWNPGVRRVLGYTEEQWIGHSSDITHVGDGDRGKGAKRELNIAGERGKSVNACWQRCANGSHIFAECTVTPLHSENGHLLGYSRMIRDLTASVHRETELQNALAWSETILNTLREALLILGTDFRVRFANSSFSRTFLIAPREMENRSVFDIAEGAWDIPAFRTLLHELLPSQSVISDYEIEHWFPSIGHKILVLNVRRVSVESHTKDESVLIAIQDVTERRTAERALRESETQRRLIMDSAPAIISYIDRSLHFRFLGGAYERWFGRSQSDLLGCHISDLYNAQTLNTVMPYIQRALSGETVTFEAEYATARGRRTLNVTYTPDIDQETGTVRGFMVLGSDVSARMTAELALKDSEERWRGLFEGMIEGFFTAEMLFDPSGEPDDFRFLQVNPAFRELTRLENVSGKTCREAIPGIELELIERYGRVVTTGQPAHFEISIAGLNSWFEVRARHTGGRQFAVLFLNITERKLIEEQVREEQRRREALVHLGDRLREIQSVSDLAFAAMEILGRTLRVGRAGFGKVAGSPLQVVVARDWTSDGIESIAGVYHFHDYGSDLGPSLQRGEVISISDVLSDPMTSANSDRWTELQIGALVNVPLTANGQLDAILYVHTPEARSWTESDLSFIRKVADRTWSAAERLRVLGELQESEEFTRSILASSPDCVKVLDLSGRLLTMNEGGCVQMEVDDVAHLRGKVWADGWADSADEARAAIDAARAGQTSRFEGFYPTAKGAPKWWEVVVTPIRNVAGETVRLLAISRDISERRIAEQDKERLTAELQRSNEDLSQFAHTVAHDLQAPLRGVTGFAQLLRRNAVSRLNETDHEFIEHITDSARHMADLVSALLRFAQLGQGMIERTPVSMDAVLDSALESLRIQLSESNAVLHCDPLPVIQGDFVQLVQLMQNLIANAIKYSRPDEPPTIRVSATQGDSVCLFRVQDNGEGIGDKYLHTIFEPLKRLHGAEIPGTGLGLSMCQRIVQRHGGRIWVESELNLGSTFYFTLPGQ